MKKVILFAAILFSSISIISVQAQVTPGYGTKESTLTLRLKPFLALSVEGSSLIVYETKDHYTDGVSVSENNPGNTVVTVSSAGSFTVSISATDLVEENKPQNKLSAAHIHVKATALNETFAKNETNETTLAALHGGTKLISALKGGLDMKYGIGFRADGGELFRQAYDNGSTKEGIQDYVTTITYTIAVK